MNTEIARFIQLAISLGVSIRVSEEHPFAIGQHGMGDEIGGHDWTLVWKITAPNGLTREQRELLQSAFQRINGVRAIQDSTVSSLCTK